MKAHPTALKRVAEDSEAIAEGSEADGAGAPLEDQTMKAHPAALKRVVISVPEAAVTDADADAEAEAGDGDDASLESASIQARRAMSFRFSKRGSSKVLRFDNASSAEIAKPVNNALAAATKQAEIAAVKETKARRMMLSQQHVNVSVVVHGDDGSEEQRFTVDVIESVRLVELKSAIEAKRGCALGSKRLFGIDRAGEVVEIGSSDAFSQFILTSWFMQPWSVHICAEQGVLQTLSIAPMAKFLFDTYDINSNGKIDRLELLRLLKDLKLERLEVSDKLLHRFVETELARLATDGSREISLHQFIEYMASMVRWMRTELTADFHMRNVHALLAARATEISLPPTNVPTARDDGSGRLVARLDAAKLGVSIEIPLGALSHDFVGEGDEAAKIALHTLTPASVRYLSESLSEVC